MQLNQEMALKTLFEINKRVVELQPTSLIIKWLKKRHCKSIINVIRLS